MRVRTLTIILLAFFPLLAFAQDAFHQYLREFWTDTYDLPDGEWLFYDNENAIYQNAISYTASVRTEDATDQVFSKQLRCRVFSQGDNPWDAGWKIDNRIPIQQGDQLLAVFYLRATTGSGTVSFFVENNSTFSKEVYLELPVGPEWRRYFVPFTSMASYTPGSLSWGFHLAHEVQTVEVGGFTAMNFNDDLELADLPSEVNNQFYGGYEVDAPWRAAAASRIEQFRKADLAITVQNTQGQPIANALVHVKMLRHQFDFGSAILASRIANNPDYNIIYANKLTNLDGNGHGFNTVVFENDLKWDAWEEEWFVNKTQLQAAVRWLEDRNLKIRGHNLVWPGTPYLPNDIPSNYGNIPYLKERINDHLEEKMLYPEVGPAIHDWDVLNEIAVNNDLANAFANTDGYTTGRELYVEIFEKARELDPNVGLWLNDYVTMTLNQQAGDPLYDRLKQYTAELVQAGVDMDGIGFQAHISGFPNSIPGVLATLDDFQQSFGLKAKITEFDLPSFVDEELAGKYLKDFMTAIYSHESTDGFLFWSFWDGQTYMNAGSNLYRNDWSETPAHTAFVDLLFNEWWTEESLSTNDEGIANSRVFKGLYEISYTCDGQLIRDTVSVADLTDYTINCQDITTDLEQIETETDIKLYPNPTGGLLNIELPSEGYSQVSVFTLTGELVAKVNTFSHRLQLDLSQYQGMLLLEINTEKGRSLRKVVIQ